MNNLYLSECQIIFGILIGFSFWPHEWQFQQLRSELQRLINEIANCLPGKEGAHVQYGIAAWCDEMILQTSWAYKDEWQANPLQVELFGEYLSGFGFFTRLSEIRGNDELWGALEIYYYCMLLGFQGQYRFGNQAEYQQLVRDTRECLAIIKRKTIATNNMTYPIPPRLNKLSQIALIKIFFYSVLILGVTYLAFSLRLWLRYQGLTAEY